jgi:hypothetical protein
MSELEISMLFQFAGSFLLIHLADAESYSELFSVELRWWCCKVRLSPCIMAKLISDCKGQLNSKLFYK